MTDNSSEMFELGRALGEMAGDPAPSDDLATADETAAFRRALHEALAAIEGIREPLEALGTDPDDVEAKAE
jgi:hypothetical protein